MKTSSAKSKGRRLQQWVVQKLLAMAPDLEPDDVTSRSMGAGGEDVLLSPAARKYYPISVECKSVAKFVGYTFMDQAIQNAKTHEPVVIIKANRRDPIVLVDADYFLKMLRSKGVPSDTDS